jgi:methylglutaconyl-CoA hydratase
MADSVLLSYPRRSVALLTLNRPDVRNALDSELVGRLSEALIGLSKDPEIRSMVITGGGSAFCAGADLATLESLQTASLLENDEDCRHLKNFYRTLATFPKPVIGAVNGPALAGGCGLASLCDVLIAAPAASFGYPEVRIGFVAAMVLVFLARQLGERLARELLLTGRLFDAEEARGIGLVNRVVPAESLIDEAVAFAEKIARGAPASLSLTKELLWHTSGMPMESALDLAARTNVFARQNPEMHEGLAAFLEKRKPKW